MLQLNIFPFSSLLASSYWTLYFLIKFHKQPSTNTQKKCFLCIFFNPSSKQKQTCCLWKRELFNPNLSIIYFLSGFFNCLPPGLWCGNCFVALRFCCPVWVWGLRVRKGWNNDEIILGCCSVWHFHTWFTGFSMACHCHWKRTMKLQNIWVGKNLKHHPALPPEKNNLKTSYFTPYFRT